jgi:predicted TIM-barrel fold metal-dependent hydrolase
MTTPRREWRFGRIYAPDETCITLFSARRCMVESNFPVDKVAVGCRVPWNAMKRLAAGASTNENRALFAGIAWRAYRLGESA